MFRVEGLQSSKSGQDKKLLRIEKTYGARGAQLERIPSHHPYQKTHMESQSIFLPMSIAHLRRKAHFCFFLACLVFGVDLVVVTIWYYQILAVTCPSRRRSPPQNRQQLGIL